MAYGMTPEDIARMNKEEKLRSKQDRLLIGWAEISDELRCSVEEAQRWAEAWEFPLFYRPAQMETGPARRTPCIFRDQLIAHLTGHGKIQPESMAGRIVRALRSLGDEVVKGRLSIKRITEKVNEMAGGRFQVGSRTIGRELKALGIPKRKSVGRMEIVWIPSAIRRLFGHYGVGEQPQARNRDKMGS